MAVAELDRLGDRRETMKTESTGVNMRNKMTCMLGLALAGLFISGCSSLPSSWRTRPIANQSSLSGKATVVVPVKGAPISLQDSDTAKNLLFGFVGTAIKESSDKPKRVALAAKLGASTNFSPEVVLAEECVAVLIQSGWSGGTNVMLFKRLEVMHGSGPEIVGDTRVFKTTFGPSEIQAWNRAHTKWMNGGPVHTFSTTEAVPGQTVILEVTLVTPFLNSGKLFLSPLMRLMDPVSGKSLASGYAEAKFQVHRLKTDADFDAFVADYRKSARKAAENLLKQLKLIP